MKVKLSRWGNSLAIRIPSPVAEQADLQEGVAIDISALPDGGLRLMPINETPTIAELVANITDDNRHQESDWDEAVGNETW